MPESIENIFFFVMASSTGINQQSLGGSRIKSWKDEPDNGEATLWLSIRRDLSELAILRPQSDSHLLKINKVHAKITERKSGNEGFTIKAAIKLLAIYSDAVEKNEAEYDVISRALDNLTLLIAHRDENSDKEAGKRKRVEDKQDSIKRTRVDDSITNILQKGDQVAAMVDEWILANVVSYSVDDAMYEVEDAEDEEEKPGTRKHYLLPPTNIIPIPKGIDTRPEFAAQKKVLALFPSTSCFYRATVVVPPSGMPRNTVPDTQRYVLIFDDDNNYERNVDSRMVLELQS